MSGVKGGRSQNTVAAIKARIEAERAEREKAVQASRIEQEKELATKLADTAELAADKLRGVIEGNGPFTESGAVDGSYVQALRLALQAGGALVERKDVTSKGEQVAAAAFVVPPKDAE